MSERNRIKVSDKNEGTRSPYWVIIDPRQNFNINDEGVYNIASAFAGIWFSRESAQNHLDNQRHNFSKNAVVFCCSGHHSREYTEAIKHGKD